MFFFFKQKTAYEMRISDWSSDVCSSDLLACHPATLCANIKGLRCKRPGKHAAFPCMIMEKRHNGRPLVQRHIRGLIKGEFPACRVAGLHQLRLQTEGKIGRAACRERVCQYV